MNLQQVIDLCDRIKIHRPNFKDGNALWQEWLKYLEKYEANDVSRALDEYLKDDVDKRVPTVTELIKGLTPLDEYKINYEYKTNCRICGRVMNNVSLEQHFNRCSSIDYIHRNAKKYFNQQVSKSDLWKLSDEQFEKGYWSFCEKLLSSDNVTPLEKAGLRNAILSNSGYEVDGTEFFKTLFEDYKVLKREE